MGVQLQHSAFSVNVKERLDFSCALLDPKGRLLANAPHIPVHLGPGHFCEIDFKKYSIQEGDIILCNHPLYGGSHLPDLTLLKGVFDTNHQLIGYVIKSRTSCRDRG
ncbi:MAG: hydantoinase B/oxoprolinase family protein [Saprospiraceae bacterium]|nr:hydantoinase B/oxoprolinase family protein [Saprospiraceae bacterium]